MNIKDIIENYHYEKLNSSHDLTIFSCGVKDLDDFLKDDALNYQERNLSVTYLAMYGGEIIGYVSLLADTIAYEKIKNDASIRLREYPAVKIGRFAVSKKYSGQHFGQELLDNTCKQINKISLKIGVSFITVDAYCNACGFYSKSKFKSINVHNPKKVKRIAERNSKKTILMFKKIEKI
ncbi:MAG: GNAT family N-acetyltransferase [Methanobrevibacter sp.]|nr:GNAT family N-acetyltransferase [Methanobrevibacter sp.]